MVDGVRVPPAVVSKQGVEEEKDEERLIRNIYTTTPTQPNPKLHQDTCMATMNAYTVPRTQPYYLQPEELDFDHSLLVKYKLYPFLKGAPAPQLNPQGHQPKRDYPRDIRCRSCCCKIP